MGAEGTQVQGAEESSSVPALQPLQQRGANVEVRDAGRKVSTSTVPRVREGVSLTFHLGSAQTSYIGILVTQSFILPAA